jgi:2-oxo-4-hydroxy-4-carboxy--5-ureidoimidazoline (OHCU) decarboxylase
MEKKEENLLTGKVNKMEKKEIIECLHSMCNRYDLDYNKNKEKIWEMLNQKIKDTNEPITDTDCKEVCKIIVFG